MAEINVSVSSDIELTESHIINRPWYIAVEDKIFFVHERKINPYNFRYADTLALSDSLGRVTDPEVSVSDQLSFSEYAKIPIILEASNTLILESTIFPPQSISGTLSFSDSATFELIKVIKDSLIFVQNVSIEFAGEVGLSNNLSFQQVAIGYILTC